jgi:putative PIN family toxin of toxin-antitoxin system
LRIVLDTNVLISALLLRDSVTRRAFDSAFTNGKVLLSFELLAELNDVLGRRQFRKYVDEVDARRFAAALLRESQWVQVATTIADCRDPKDNRILSVWEVSRRQLGFLLCGCVLMPDHCLHRVSCAD